MDTSKTIEIIGKIVCDNQLLLSQYSFVANEKHKKLKTIISNPEKYQYEDLGAGYVELEEYLYEEFGKAFDKNALRLFDFFNSRNEIKPRICIKIIIQGELVTLYRCPVSRTMEIEDKPFRFTDNTAFVEISKGEPYFCLNNIPDAIRAEKYTNGRIDKAKVLKYLSSNEEYNTWESCWNKVQAERGGESTLLPSNSCYQSTLVVPMSLKTEDLSSEFKNHFSLTNVSKERERVIFGFLCLDHQSTDFFNLPMDVTVVYIVADLLSLYLIQQLTHTEYSEVYRRAKKYLDI